MALVREIFAMEKTLNYLCLEQILCKTKVEIALFEKTEQFCNWKFKTPSRVFLLAINGWQKMKYDKIVYRGTGLQNFVNLGTMSRFVITFKLKELDKLDQCYHDAWVVSLDVNSIFVVIRRPYLLMESNF